ncbi:hypothetical protein AAFF_G00113840 [Aldrovandia affinis]|uniref:Uncharacterized protein n=1 Tax=Aldrovandia affinis TaxID=143900 RepID=A0AAD7RTG3_9TELE|nr:hypothetical protein AAFF_G00113840 [Aldrovandia affinis]
MHGAASITGRKRWWRGESVGSAEAPPPPLCVSSVEQQGPACSEPRGLTGARELSVRAEDLGPRAKRCACVCKQRRSCSLYIYAPERLRSGCRAQRGERAGGDPDVLKWVRGAVVLGAGDRRSREPLGRWPN